MGMDSQMTFNQQPDLYYQSVLRGIQDSNKVAYRNFKRDEYSNANHDSFIKKPLKRLDNQTKTGVWKRGAQHARNQNHLNNLLKPKNAFTLLQQIKPGSSIKIIDEGLSNPARYTAHVEYDNGILATGTGTSKMQAKTKAAENVLKNLMADVMAQKNFENADDELPNPDDNLSLIPLASFALYKLFKEWEVAKDITALPKTNPPGIKSEKVVAPKKDLPPNALEIHPSSLINLMMPGINPYEIRRTQPPDSTVTMGYKIDGIVYTGTARNKKEARKEAAKAVLLKYYGLHYPN